MWKQVRSFVRPITRSIKPNPLQSNSVHTIFSP
jgi:hypothetical protein